MPPRHRHARPDRREILAAIVPPVLLIFAVLGAILGGIATPTEAASVGAIGALLMAGARSGSIRRLILTSAPRL
jgi:TRAP-type mannitol/chloroaromatic compound transport system permease large subunit